MTTMTVYHSIDRPCDKDERWKREFGIVSSITCPCCTLTTLHRYESDWSIRRILACKNRYGMAYDPERDAYLDGDHTKEEEFNRIVCIVCERNSRSRRIRTLPRLALIYDAAARLSIPASYTDHEWRKMRFPTLVGVKSFHDALFQAVSDSDAPTFIRLAHKLDVLGAKRVVPILIPHSSHGRNPLEEALHIRHIDFLYDVLRNILVLSHIRDSHVRSLIEMAEASGYHHTTEDICEMCQRVEHIGYVRIIEEDEDEDPEYVPAPLVPILITSDEEEEDSADLRDSPDSYS